MVDLCRHFAFGVGYDFLIRRTPIPGLTSPELLGFVPGMGARALKTLQTNMTNNRCTLILHKPKSISKFIVINRNGLHTVGLLCFVRLLSKPVTEVVV